MTYSSGVSQDIVDITFRATKLKYFGILAGVIQNMYLNIKTEEILSFYFGDEWRYEQGNVKVIVRALYWLELSFLY